MTDSQIKIEAFEVGNPELYRHTSFKWPEHSEWRCELFGAGPNGILLRPLKGHEPNWFWR